MENWDSRAPRSRLLRLDSANRPSFLHSIKPMMKKKAWLYIALTHGDVTSLLPGDQRLKEKTLDSFPHVVNSFLFRFCLFFFLNCFWFYVHLSPHSKHTHTHTQYTVWRKRPLCPRDKSTSFSGEGVELPVGAYCVKEERKGTRRAKNLRCRETSMHVSLSMCIPILNHVLILFARCGNLNMGKNVQSVMHWCFLESVLCVWSSWGRALSLCQPGVNRLTPPSSLS